MGANLPAPIGYLRVTSPSFGFFLVYYMILIVILLPPKTKSRLLNKINSFLRSKRCVALASAFTVFMFLLVLLLSRKRNMEILYFDVGQGSSALVRSSDGICGLFDGGNGYTDVSSLLFKNGIGHLDFIALSHGDLDHAGGLQKVLEEHSVDILLVPDNSDDSGTMETVRTAMKNGCQIIAVTRHCSIELSQELQMKIYFKRDLKSLNNSSLVIQLISTNGNVVFPGDLELSGENQLRREGFPDKCDLLTIAHHGSDSGTGAAFLEKLQPEYAIISVGRNNRYGHPSEKVLDRLSEAGIETYRTDLHGAVRVTFCSRSLVDTWIGQRERIVEIKPWQNEMK